MSWWDTDDDEDEPYGEYDESSVRVRPNPKGNRPRTKTRPEHEDAVVGRVLGVDRGRYTVLVDEGTPDEHEATAARASELRKQAVEWSVTRGARSGRVAWQFIQEVAGQLGKKLE